MRYIVVALMLLAPAACWSADEYRIVHGRPAPWASRDTSIDPALRNAVVRFSATTVVAPYPLGCTGAKTEWVFPPLEGLFEGGLKSAAEAKANDLGTERVPTMRVSCSTGSFDYHRTAGGELRIALDNVVWSLRPTSTRGDPQTVVRELLIAHFTHDMAFTPESTARKRGALSTPLARAIDAWFAAPQSEDEVPAIDGDPFTDSQEYPDRFSIGAAKTIGARVQVPVLFADDHASKTVKFSLIREGATWRIDDVVDSRGGSLRTLLFESTPIGGFMRDLRNALAGADAARVAALMHAPFLYDGRELDRAQVIAIVPELFTPAVRKCLANVEPIAEDDRFVAFCKPYAFYIGKDGDAMRILEFAADGEDAP